jgi:hypothetical protein
MTKKKPLAVTPGALCLVGMRSHLGSARSGEAISNPLGEDQSKG